MQRRNFLHSLGLAGAAGLTAVPAAVESSPLDNSTTSSAALHASHRKTFTEKAWLFWDLWHCERLENAMLRQGRAERRPEGTFIDPVMWGLNSWPTVYRDAAAGQWRMLYSALWKPFSLLVAGSDDGIHWQPLPVDAGKLGRQALVNGERLAPNHLFTLEAGSGGGVYIDPIAADGFRFKAFCHQQQEPVLRRALADENHRWHKIAKAEGVKKYLNDEVLLVSRDGLQWEVAPDGRWGLADWHPEPPLFGFYNAHVGRHMMTVRPGWGDRRVCLQASNDCRQWDGPELLLQPDPLDADLAQFYGMPVFPYVNTYVGLLWLFHAASSEPVRGFNQFVGYLDCQLAYSYDGLRFARALREPLVALSPPGEDGCGSIQPSCLVETEREIRIYSGSSKIQHGMSRSVNRDKQQGEYAIVLHTLRRDGFTYLESRGGWAFLQSKPFTLLGGGLTANIAATHGEAVYQLTNLKSEPLTRFTFDDCEAIRGDDAIARPLTWRGGELTSLRGKALRLEVKFRDARLYSFRGNFHFLDAQDAWLLDDGKPIDPTLFDF